MEVADSRVIPDPCSQETSFCLKLHKAGQGWTRLNEARRGMHASTTRAVHQVILRGRSLVSSLHSSCFSSSACLFARIDIPATRCSTQCLPLRTGCSTSPSPTPKRWVSLPYHTTFTRSSLPFYYTKTSSSSYPHVSRHTCSPTSTRSSIGERASTGTCMSCPWSSHA